MPNKKILLVGNWERITESECSRVYPTHIEFSPNELYSGSGTEPGEAPGWDAGTWRVEGSNQVKISTSNDAILTYQFSLRKDKLKFLSPDGCTFEYRRVK